MNAGREYYDKIDPAISLQLGDVVEVVRTCKVEYDEEGVRKLVFGDGVAQAVLVGRVKKALGVLVPAYASGEFGEEWIPARLAVSKYVWLYECKVTLEGKVFLVDGKDLRIWV